MLHYNNKLLIASPHTSKKSTTCDLCQSSDFAESKLGKVCKRCGVVIEQKVLEYHAPYSETRVQHAPLNSRTQVGSVFERLNSRNSSKLRSLAKTNLRYNQHDQQLEIGKIEISRLFHALQLPHNLKKEVFLAYREVRNRIPAGTKFRSPAGLAAVVVYTMMKLRRISIDQIAILEVSHLSRKEFNEFKLRVCPLFKDYSKRDRKSYVAQKILQVSEHFKLGMEFYFRSKRLLDGLWGKINNTSDEVAAGVIASLSLLIQGSEVVTVSSICKKLGIMPSTVHSQVRKHLIAKYEVQGYKSLVKSRDVIKEVLEKLGLINDK